MKEKMNDELFVVKEDGRGLLPGGNGLLPDGRGLLPTAYCLFPTFFVYLCVTSWQKKGGNP